MRSGERNCGKSDPQRLKPRIIGGCNGTTEVVPLHGVSFHGARYLGHQSSYDDFCHNIFVKDLHTPKTTRRSTRVRVQIPVSVTSLDRRRPFAEKCMVLVASAQGCGFRSSRALQMETPIMINDLPGGGSVTGHVANCLPLGHDGFLIGVSLYTQGNVWGIANPPEDWKAASSSAAPASIPNGAENAAKLTVNKKVWPYNLFAEGVETHPGRK